MIKSLSVIWYTDDGFIPSLCNIVLGQISNDAVQVVWVGISVFAAPQAGLVVNVVPGDTIVGPGSDGSTDGEDEALFVSPLQQSQHFPPFLSVRQIGDAREALAIVTPEISFINNTDIGMLK